MGAVERFCDRAMLLERGDVIATRRAARRSRCAYNELNFGRLVHDERRAAAATATRRRARSTARGSRTPTASGSPTIAQGEPLHDRDARCASTSAIDEPDLRVRAAQRGRPHRLRDVDRSGCGDRRPATSRPATPSRSASRFDNWLAPSRYKLTPVGRPRGRRRRRARPARGPRVAGRPRHARRPAASSTCRTRSRSSAR